MTLRLYGTQGYLLILIIFKRDCRWNFPHVKMLKVVLFEFLDYELSHGTLLSFLKTQILVLFLFWYMI